MTLLVPASRAAGVVFMRTTPYGRVVFGASAVLLGTIALRWHDPATWQALRQIWSLPSGIILGTCLMTLQIAGGLAMQYPRTVRPASFVLSIVYLLFSLACIPGIIAAPTIYDPYSGFFEQFCALCGSLALFAATEVRAARALAFGKLARLGLGVCAICFTAGQIFYLRVTADLVPRWIPPNQMFWAILTTIAFALAALAILTNRRARLATQLMTLMLALFGVLVWIPRLIAHPRAHLNWSEGGLTFLIMGAAWLVSDLRLLGWCSLAESTRSDEGSANR